MKYVHTNIITRDWKRLSAFYEKVFHCEMVPPERNQEGDWLSSGTGVANASLRGVHMRLPGYDREGPTLEIYEYGHSEDNLLPVANRVGFGHIAFEVGDVHQTLNEVVTHGGSLLGEVVMKEIHGKGKLTFTYARDPDGNLIEIQRWK